MLLFPTLGLGQTLVFKDTITMQSFNFRLQHEVFFQTTSDNPKIVKKAILLDYYNERFLFGFYEFTKEIPKSELNGIWIKPKAKEKSVNPYKWFKIYLPNCTIEKVPKKNAKI
jgi:hypothetical protein